MILLQCWGVGQSYYQQQPGVTVCGVKRMIRV